MAEISKTFGSAAEIAQTIGGRAEITLKQKSKRIIDFEKLPYYPVQTTVFINLTYFFNFVLFLNFFYGLIMNKIFIL